MIYGAYLKLCHWMKPLKQSELIKKRSARDRVLGFRGATGSGVQAGGHRPLRAGEMLPSADPKFHNAMNPPVQTSSPSESRFPAVPLFVRRATSRTAGRHGPVHGLYLGNPHGRPGELRGER